MGVVFEDSRARVAQIFAELDSVERSLDEGVQALRAEAERLSGELSKAGEEPLEAAAPELPAEDGAGAQTEPEAAAETELESPAPATDPAVRELIRQQLVSFAKDGRTRADAERMLLRFKQGDQYFDLLDDIYPDETPGRRGLLRRRKKDD
jgi:hypothetical protein